jgi:cytochrome c-type biogenesis protein CcmH
MLWFLMGIMLLVAALVVAWPFYKHQRRFSLLSAAMVVGVIGLSAGLYSQIGTPDGNAIKPVEPGLSSVEDMVQALDARLQAKPDDPEGWKMLGRSYMQIGDKPKAIGAFEKAVELEDSSNGETLISLGEAILMKDQSAVAGRAGQLFETGLAMIPGNPRALFYAGLAAAQRGDTALAADRWEALLAQSPPPEIVDLLRRRVAEWRGVAVDAREVPVPPVAEPAAVVSIEIRIADDAVAAISTSSTVFVIARDPAQPSPPLAVARRRVEDLPTVVSMSDADAMVQGRVLSAYENLEIIVRVSASGQPIAQPGDWYGQSLFRPADGDSVAIVVNRQIPGT